MIIRRIGQSAAKPHESEEGSETIPTGSRDRATPKCELPRKRLRYSPLLRETASSSNERVVSSDDYRMQRNVWLIKNMDVIKESELLEAPPSKVEGNQQPSRTETDRLCTEGSETIP